jgi:hypothetical protein
MLKFLDLCSLRNEEEIKKITPRSEVNKIILMFVYQMVLL